MRGSEPHPALASPPLGVRLGPLGPLPAWVLRPAPRVGLVWGSPPQASGERCRCPAFRGLESPEKASGRRPFQLEKVLQQVSRVLNARAAHE